MRDGSSCVDYCVAHFLGVSLADFLCGFTPSRKFYEVASRLTISLFGISLMLLWVVMDFIRVVDRSAVLGGLFVSG